jgi:hypothetical protein
MQRSSRRRLRARWVLRPAGATGGWCYDLSCSMHQEHTAIDLQEPFWTSYWSRVRHVGAAGDQQAQMVPLTNCMTALLSAVCRYPHLKQQGRCMVHKREAPEGQ